MNELKMTHIKDVNPMINNMAIKGRCISIWHSHKLNEEHDPYSLDCVFQDVEVFIFFNLCINKKIHLVYIIFNCLTNVNRMREFRFTSKRSSCLNLNPFFKRDSAI
jgi:hypothetical protein